MLPQITGLDFWLVITLLSYSIVYLLQNQRIRKWLVSEGTRGGHLVQPPLQTGSPKACLGSCLDSYWIPPRIKTPQPLRYLASPESPHTGEVFPNTQMEPPGIHCVLLPLILSLDTTGKSLAPFFLHHSIRFLYTLVGSALTLPFSRLTSPNSISLSSYDP